MSNPKIQKKWDQRKNFVMKCPICRGKNIHLCVHLHRVFNRYWLECFQCHWCGADANTIKGAIRLWNIR